MLTVPWLLTVVSLFQLFLKSFSKNFSELPIHTTKVICKLISTDTDVQRDIRTQYFIPQLSWNTFQRRKNVVKKLLFTALLVTDDLPKLPRLLKVLVHNRSRKCGYMSSPDLMGWHLNAMTDGYWTKLGEDIVWVTSVISVHGAWTVADVGGVYLVDWSIWWELEVVGANPWLVSQ